MTDFVPMGLPLYGGSGSRESYDVAYGGLSPGAHVGIFTGWLLILCWDKLSTK